MRNSVSKDAWKTIAARSSLLLLMAAGCADSGTEFPASPTADDPSTIYIGMVGTFSGDDADLARQTRVGVELALSQINAAGGILGRHVDLVTEDDAGQAATLEEKLNLLKNRGISVVIGPTTNAMAIAALPFAREEKLFLVSPTVSSSALNVTLAAGATAPPPNLLRTLPSDDLLASSLVVVAKQTSDDLPEDTGLKVGEARCSRIGVVYQTDAYGRAIFDVLERRAIAENVNIVRKSEIDVNNVTEAALDGVAGQMVTAATTGKAQCQIIVARARVAGAYMRAFRARIDEPATAAARSWGTFTTVGTEAFTQDAFISSGRQNPADPTSDTAGNGSVAVAANTRPRTQSYSIFREVFRSRLPGEEPGPFVSSAYDAAILAGIAMERRGSTSDIPGFRKAFYEFGIGEVVTSDDVPFLFARVRSGVPINFEGVSGGLQFNDFGSVDGSFVIGRVLSNRFVAYKKVLESSQLQ